MVQDCDVFCSEGLFFCSILLRVLRQSIGSFVSLALTIIDSEVVAREFLGLANLSGAQTLCLHEPTEVVVVEVRAPCAETLLGSASML